MTEQDSMSVSELFVEISRLRKELAEQEKSRQSETDELKSYIASLEEEKKRLSEKCGVLERENSVLQERNAGLDQFVYAAKYRQEASAEMCELLRKTATESEEKATKAKASEQESIEKMKSLETLIK